MEMTSIDGGVTAAKGFLAAAVQAGIKYEGRLDMAMIFSELPCAAAGTFTSNLVKAAPVLWDRKIVEERGSARAVVVNAGIANACTGDEGIGYCASEAAEAAQALGIQQEEVLCASTGVIGMQLPIGKIQAGIRQLSQSLGNSREAAAAAARAIMTTDTVPKEAAVQVEIGGCTVTVGGMCKGSGMIHPNMCTMLSFVTTDAAISQELLAKAVRASAQATYNMVSVDGDTSTNDTLLVLANGAARNAQIQEGSGEYEAFCRALDAVNRTLAKKMAKDGEGATTLIEARVIRAGRKEQAAALAKSVVSSSLVKAAVCGNDANWCRILCAMGYAGETFDPGNMDLWFSSEAGQALIYRDGKAADYSEEEAARILSCQEVTVTADLKEGTEEAEAWGCDLTYDYVRINADYRS